MNLRVETDREEDGHWMADIPELPGVLVYGETREQAIAFAEALERRVIAERLENGEAFLDVTSQLFSIIA